MYLKTILTWYITCWKGLYKIAKRGWKKNDQVYCLPFHFSFTPYFLNEMRFVFLMKCETLFIRYPFNAIFYGLLNSCYFQPVLLLFCSKGSKLFPLHTLFKKMLLFIFEREEKAKNAWIFGLRRDEIASDVFATL